MQVSSAALMTVSARWYAASAADGMPAVVAVEMACAAPPAPMPGATPSGEETLAGASMAWEGMLGAVGQAGRRKVGSAVRRRGAGADPGEAHGPGCGQQGEGHQGRRTLCASNRSCGHSVSPGLRTKVFTRALPHRRVRRCNESCHGKVTQEPDSDEPTQILSGRRHDAALEGWSRNERDRRGLGHIPRRSDPDPRRRRVGPLGDNEAMSAATRPTPDSEALFARARGVTPGGVNSPVRAFNAVGGTPRFIRSAAGARLTDVDGNEYVDLICSWGPMLLGHAHPEVQAAVQAAVARGTSYGTPTEPEVELAEEIVARTPVERVRFVSSGTEATMSAIRLARGFTGRDVVVKFAGCYHGHVDALLASAGSGLATFAVPGTPGVPASSTGRRWCCPTTTARPSDQSSPSTATGSPASITEAAPGNMGVVPPEPGFNRFLAETCARHGALFVSDEVMTGFRASKQGQWGLDGAVEGWRPDLVTFGKVMGGGFPAAAFGGRADVMGRLAPGRAGLPGRHPVREPDRDHGRAHHAAAGDRRGLRPHRRRRRDDQGRGDRGAGGGRRTPRDPGERHHVLRLPHRGTGPRLRGRLAHQTRRRTPPSSTPCSTRGSTSRRRRTRPGSSRPPTTTARCRPCSTPCPPQPARRPQPWSRHECHPDTIVHLLRHGEVHNPQGVLYGRRDGFHLSVLGNRMADRVAETIGERDITHLVSSPLERAQETARPLAAARGLEIATDDRVIESTTVFEGMSFGEGAMTLVKRPKAVAAPAQPAHPVVGRAVQADRGPDDGRGGGRPGRRGRPRGRHRVPPAPIWTTRLHVEKRSFLHDPRSRQCTLCSLTSLHFVGDRLAQVSYSEPAGDLIPVGDRKAPFSAGGASEENRP